MDTSPETTNKCQDVTGLWIAGCHGWNEGDCQLGRQF